MTVRAKFKVIEKTERYGGNGAVDVKLAAVTDGSDENKQFWKWTPTGVITMSTINKDAADQFGIGDEFYVDFTKA
jgi:hypothetical protein